MVNKLPSRLIGLAGFAFATYWAMLSPRSQLLGSFCDRGSPAEKVIALTFDDGPNEPFTSHIGNFLANEGIRVTFFQVGRCVERFPEATESLVRQGHVIGNHSYSHELMKCLLPGAQRQQTQQTQQILERILGHVPALYRPPWLVRTPALYATLKSYQLQAISGTFCHPLEVFQPSPERIAARALSTARPGSILIFHDGYNSGQADRTNTVEAVKLVVAALTNRGYRFVTIDELLDIPAYRLPPAGC